MAGLVTLGEAMTLMVGLDSLPLRQASTFYRSVAGSETNVAVGFARLGREARWIGRVGDDALGEQILRQLRMEGVGTEAVVRDREAATGTLIRDHHARRPIEVIYHRDGSAGSRLGPEDVKEAWFEDAALLHVTALSASLSDSAHRAVLRACEIAKAKGISISFDPNTRVKVGVADQRRALIEEIARQATLVLAGLEESRDATGKQSREDVADWYRERGAGLVVLRDGAEGSWATDGDSSWTQPVFPARVVDPIGAGDAYCAAFLVDWLAGEGVQECMRSGSAAGAIVVEALGDIEALPTRDELRARVAGDTESNR